MAGSNTAAPNTAGTNRIHHQSGVLPSANDVSLSVSQPGPRLFSTIGARCNSAGGANVFKLVAASAINLLLSFRPGERPVRPLFSMNWDGRAAILDCGGKRSATPL